MDTGGAGLTRGQPGPMKLFARLARRFEDRDARMTRREFVQASAVAAGALLLSAAPTRAANRRKVIILGGGFGGLACGYELKAAGFEVVVLEARNRVGGRVLSFSDFIPGRVVEGGGELIGANHPTWNAYARRFGLHLVEVPDDEDQALELGGRLIPQAEAERIYKGLDAAYATLVAPARKVAEPPWTTPQARALDERDMGDWLRDLSLPTKSARVLRAEIESDAGAALEKLSYLGRLVNVKAGGYEAYFTDSESHRCAQGNQALAHKLAGGIGHQAVRLGVPVKAVKVRSNGCKVTLASGEIVEGDDVVLTLPPSVWKDVHFDPPLPFKVPIGTNVKYLARFTGKPGPTPNTLSDGPVAFTWEEGPGAFAAFAGGPAAVELRSEIGGAADEYFKEQLAVRFPTLKLAEGRFMDWPGERYTKGGYTCTAPGVITGLGPTLRQGLGRLHFAGEFASMEFCGFMEGGLHSGAALARRLAGA